jgi:hypothetical protein
MIGVLKAKNIRENMMQLVLVVIFIDNSKDQGEESVRQNVVM